MSGPEVPGGRGVPVERTLLAWRRTSLSVAAGGALLLRSSYAERRVLGLVLGAACVVAALAVSASSARDYRRRIADPGAAPRRPVALTAALIVVAVVCVSGVVVELALVRGSGWLTPG